MIYNDLFLIEIIDMQMRTDNGAVILTVTVTGQIFLVPSSPFA
jgi:hypothetical protein